MAMGQTGRMRAAAHFVPSYWCVVAINGAGSLTDTSSGAVAPLMADIGVTLLFALVLIAVALALGRARMRELWARIVFNIAVSNTDDHLRNHGFLLTSSGWRLAPAYDVNPNIYGESLSLNIDFEENALDFELAMPA